jgi:osmoprotectant transport system permease protein
MTRMLAILAVLLIIAAWPRPAGPRGVRIGSKKFTESVILGEILVQLVKAGGDRASHLAELGGTQIVFDALRRGEIDAYPEYTGTLAEEIYAGRDASTPEKLAALLKADGVAMSASLGFSNNYALAVSRSTAERLDLKTIADLTKHPDLRLGLSNEFLDRADGWKGLRTAYGLSQQPTGMDHDLAYRYLDAGTIDVTDVYTTDARLTELDLVLLDDNKSYFPGYEAVLLTRVDLPQKSRRAADVIAKLSGKIDQERMRELNAEVESRTLSESQAAAGFLLDEFSIKSHVTDESVANQVLQRTWEHLDLVRRSLIPAIFVAVPLGVLAAKLPRLGRVILGITGVVQTIPALALLVLLIAPVAYFGLDTLGAGSVTAIVALFLYSLLPIVQNTAAGITGIAPEYRESATALGLAPWFRLLHVELPLASPSILAGVKTSAILNVGFATLGALVGARGYGQPILSGIRVNDMGLILQGAIPAAGLAILLQIAFEISERWFVPAGLRLAVPSKEQR